MVNEFDDKQSNVIPTFDKDFEEKIQKEIDACITENEIDDLITSL